MDKEILRQFIQQYSRSSRSETGQMLDYFEEKAYQKNEYFVRAGKVSDNYYFLADGFMRAFTLDVGGNEVTTYFYAAGKMVFEVSSFFTRTPATENIQAVSDCKGYSLSFEKLNKLFHALPEFREFGRAMLVREFGAYKKRALGLINQSATERYVHLINAHPEVFQHAQLRYIASYLGVTDASLSRIRREYSKKE